MTIVLIGPPGAGKTRVGKRLAKHLGVDFTDTDAVITAEHGPIAEIFAQSGEARFRALERAAVARSLGSGGVVSLGGGAVLDPRTQADLARATVILLTITADAVTSRIGNGKRPLISDLDSWRALAAQRAPLYASLADYTADTSHRPLSRITEEIAAWLQEHTA